MVEVIFVRHRQTASAHLKALTDQRLLQEIKAGREKPCINPGLSTLAVISRREDRKMYRQPLATGVRFPSRSQ
ncbi:MAG: hypothetical protein EOR73_21035 [Mesorhizobium sp.]|nr:MAG: hypothetical protein EOR73_21035 [Mesorhizobium sp.]